ncbi:uncharacterized protein LOC106133684 [Amyelois transitella]|uniref:uncharacterized protein LOC106133684 n=1 Tax=Amyelois transitella TaxID=680683 RepID=UPI00298F9321|nr:uncharacterized protein LOC106133684 [Amyelois transitella]
MSLFINVLVLISVSALKINFNEHNKIGFFDYGVNWNDQIVNKETDLRTKFLEKKRNNIDSKKRIYALERVTSNNIEYLDGIPHYKVGKSLKSLRDVEKLENNFKSLVKMEGVQYDYKRDMHWRTWREVAYPNMSKIVVCYRCENIVNTTCETCTGSGSWAIEENLPCPFELFSIINKNEICAVNYKQINKIREQCPLIIKLSDLRDCNNPIETKYLVKRDFKSASERSTNLCKEREYCEISTIYTILPNRTTFRIINSSNHIIYSRIMKFGRENYVCIEDCGIYNPTTKKITTNEKPFIVDLLDKSHKNKREDLLNETVYTNETTQSKTTSMLPIKIGIKIYKNPHFETARKKKEEIKFKYNDFYASTTQSSCKKMQTTTQDEYELDEYFEAL